MHAMRAIYIYIYKERVPVDEVCEHIPENYFKHPIALVHRSINSYNRKLLNYLIREKYIQFPSLHAVLCSDIVKKNVGVTALPQAF